MRNIIIISVALGGILSAVFGVISWRARTAKAGGGVVQLVLYAGENFTGRSVTVAGTTFDLPVLLNQSGGEDFNWNDEVRSLVVSGGTWRLYQNGRCNTELDSTRIQDFNVRAKVPVGGWSTLVSGLSTGPLEVPSVAAGGIWCDISSIELVSVQNLPDWAMDFRK